jgi:hypothetical protein
VFPPTLPARHRARPSPQPWVERGASATEGFGQSTRPCAAPFAPGAFFRIFSLVGGGAAWQTLRPVRRRGPTWHLRPRREMAGTIRRRSAPKCANAWVGSVRIAARVLRSRRSALFWGKCQETICAALGASHSCLGSFQNMRCGAGCGAMIGRSKHVATRPGACPPPQSPGNGDAGARRLSPPCPHTSFVWPSAGVFA